MHLMEQRDIILNGTQALGPIAVGLTHEAAEQILRVVRVGISAKATWGMVAMRALQRARQIRDNDILTVGDIREVEQALKRWGEYDAFHPPILGHTA